MRKITAFSLCCLALLLSCYAFAAGGPSLKVTNAATAKEIVNKFVKAVNWGTSLSVNVTPPTRQDDSFISSCWAVTRRNDMCMVDEKTGHIVHAIRFNANASAKPSMTVTIPPDKAATSAKNYLALAGNRIDDLELFVAINPNDLIAHFKKMYKGVPFDGQFYAVVELDPRTGGLASLSCSADVPAPADMTVSVEQEAAISYAKAFVGVDATKFIGAVKLIVKPNDFYITEEKTPKVMTRPTTRLAWVVYIQGTSPTAEIRKEVWVDTETGQVLGGRNIP